jgi:hypothetical protein
MKVNVQRGILSIFSIDAPRLVGVRRPRQLIMCSLAFPAMTGAALSQLSTGEIESRDLAGERRNIHFGDYEKDSCRTPLCFRHRNISSFFS